MKIKDLTHATHVTYKEGDFWHPFTPWNGPPEKPPPALVHSIKFSDGSIWDAVNGWRPEPRR